MNKKPRYTIILTAVSLLASVGVSSTFLLTRDIIKQREVAVRTNALYTVLPGMVEEPVEITSVNTNDEDRIYKGLDHSGKIIGYAAAGEAQGYSSKIKIMVGIDAQLKKILGIDILAQKETPGLGTQMTEIESTKTLWSTIFGLKNKSKSERNGETWNLEQKPEIEPRPWFQEQFKNKTFHQLVVSKEEASDKIVAITGATISTDAAIQAVKNAINKIRQSIQTPDWEIK